MQYSFSPKLKMLSLILMVIGLIAFAIGTYQNSHVDEHAMEEKMSHMTHEEKTTPMHSKQMGHMEHDNDHATHLEHSMIQWQNKPWAAAFVAVMFFFGISAAALFFLAIQHASNSGWSIVVTRVLEGIASYAPVGGILLLIIVLSASFGYNHLYHWMDPDLVDKTSPHFDILIFSKSAFLNVTGFSIFSVFAVAGVTFFMMKLKSLSKNLDTTKDTKDWKSLHTWSVLYIVFFALTSAVWAWYWLMSIDPHWYSTLYIWYTMVSCLVSAVAWTLIISVYLESKGSLKAFNDNHQHDLTKYMFGFSLLWGYLFFDQFMLIWYANIPEEVVYFLGRYQLYRPTYFPMLIPNVLLVLLILISSSMKRRPWAVIIMAFVVILGHWLDYFNIIMPGTVGPFWSFGTMEIGALLFVTGLFIYVVFTALSQLNLEATGNPYWKESKVYEYPF